MKKKTVYILGDSHTKYFEMIEYYNLLEHVDLQCLKIGGATAAGIMNVNSSTQARVKFDQFLYNIPKNADIGFHLGEVDCGAAIWVKCRLHRLNPYDVMIKSVCIFFEYIDKCIKLGYKNIFITSATLPTITDEDIEKQRIPIRNNINIPQLDRMLLTQNFNSELKRRAELRGLKFIDVSPLVIDPKTTFLSTFLRSKNTSDHHMDYTLAPVIWADVLRLFFDKMNYDSLQDVTVHALQDTYIKAVAINSRELHSSLKIKVKKGQKLMFKKSENYKRHTRMYQARLNGLYINPRYQFMFPLHWGE